MKNKILITILTIFFFIGCKKTIEQKQEAPSLTSKPINKSVIGGQPININSTPYQCAIFLTRGSNPEFNAGGVILSENWILTAAHVVTDLNGQQIAANRLSIRTGSSNLTNGITTAVDQVIRHPNYSNPANDIALIHLATPLTFNANTDAIVYEKAPAITLVHDIATVSGWGAIAFNSSTGVTTGTNDLFAANVKISAIEPSLIYTSSTSSTQQAPCYGDSGGPLTVDVYGYKVLVGVVNGWGDCNVGTKGYALVSAFSSWILAQTGINGTPSITTTVKNNSSTGAIYGGIAFKRGGTQIAVGQFGGAQNFSNVSIPPATYTLELALAPNGVTSILVEVNGSNPTVVNVSSSGGSAIIGDYNVSEGFYVNGYSPYYANTAKSGTFVKNNCPTGYSGSQVIYSIAAGTSFSGISQSDADAKATSQLNTDGQSYANSIGTCRPTNSVEFINSTTSSTFFTFKQNGNLIKQLMVNSYANFVDTTIPAGSYTVETVAPGASYPVKITIGGTTKTGISTSFNGISVGSGILEIKISNP